MIDDRDPMLEASVALVRRAGGRARAAAYAAAVTDRGPRARTRVLDALCGDHDSEQVRQSRAVALAAFLVLVPEPPRRVLWGRAITKARLQARPAARRASAILSAIVRLSATGRRPAVADVAAATGRTEANVRAVIAAAGVAGVVRDQPRRVRR